MRLINIDDDRNCYIGFDGEYEKWNIDPDVLAEATTKVWIPDSCRNCNNHPVNGGSGICNCILGGIQWV